jgi:hypothetical protein
MISARRSGHVVPLEPGGGRIGQRRAQHEAVLLRAETLQSAAARFIELADYPAECRTDRIGAPRGHNQRLPGEADSECSGQDRNA